MTDDGKQIKSSKTKPTNYADKNSQVLRDKKKSARIVKIYKYIIKNIFHKLKHILKKLTLFRGKRIGNGTNNYINYYKNIFYSDRYNANAIIRRKALGHEPSLSELRVLEKNRIDGGEENE